jgi:hypothetical protein
MVDTDMGMDTMIMEMVMDTVTMVMTMTTMIMVTMVTVMIMDMTMMITAIEMEITEMDTETETEIMAIMAGNQEISTKKISENQSLYGVMAAIEHNFAMMCSISKLHVPREIRRLHVAKT